MTDPSQYFKGRTVQEQMNEVIDYVDVRSAEVATAAIAADVAQVHQDMLDADADATAAAASAVAAAGTLANAVKKTGEASQSIAGNIAVSGDLSGGTVTVPTPVNNTDAANKKYVDDADALKINITDVNTYAVGLTGNQTKAGELTLVNPVPMVGKWYTVGSNGLNRTYWAKICTISIPNRTTVGAGRCIILEVQVGREYNRGMHAFLYVMGTGFHVSGFYLGIAPVFKMTVDNDDDNLVTLWVKYDTPYSTIIAREVNDRSYNNQLNYEERVTMNTDTTVIADISGYTTSYDPTPMVVIQ